MNINIFAYSNKGCELAKKIAGLFSEAECYTTERLGIIYGFNAEKSVCNKVGELFSASKALIFIGACGIAVRAIAPYVKNKALDPAVVVIDDCGNYAISLLSGHIGGANDLAEFIAKKIGAIPIITTATDVNGRFSVDSWAVKNDLIIGNMKTAKEVSAQILIKDIAFKSDIKFHGNFPEGLVHSETGKIGVYVSYKTLNPFENTLHIIPKNIHIGIGCKRNTCAYEIDKFYKKILNYYNIDFRSVKDVSTIDIKKDEIGLLEFSEQYKLPISFYTSKELNELDGDFTKSDFVKNITGTDNICERASYKSSGSGRIIVKKTTSCGISIAICQSNKEVFF